MAPSRTEGAVITYVAAPVLSAAPPVSPPQRVTERNSDLMRTPEAARYIDMSESWLRQSRIGLSDGPPFLRQGRAIRYRRCDLDRWLERRLCGGDLPLQSRKP